MKATANSGADGASERLSVRAALVHDWFQGYHGAERVVDVMCHDLFLAGHEPDVFTFHAAHELLPPNLSRAIVQESSLARLPGIRQRGHEPGRWRYLLPYMPRYFRSLDLSSYELVLVSSHSCALHARAPTDAALVLYSYTPARYIWTPHVDARGSIAARWAMRAYAPHLRRVDQEAALRATVIVAISTAVRERIRSSYARDAVVVHPPVDVHEFSAARAKDPGLFLSVHRLVSYKGPERVIAAFSELPYKLVIVGLGPLAAKLQRSLPRNVTLLPWLPRTELVELFARATGFVHIAEEDFGISMVEALASGTPVLGLSRGGAMDIVRPGHDGVLIDSPDVGEIRRGVLAIAEAEWDRAALVARSHQFSRQRFVREMSDVVRAAMSPGSGM